MKTKRKIAPRRRRDAAATREALLSAGADLFAQRGFDGATIGRIARLAKANTAMISYYFGGKKGLYHAILTDSFSLAQERLRILRSTPLSAENRFKQFVEAWSGFMARRPALPAMIVRELVSGGRLIDDRVFPYFLSILGFVKEVIEQGVKDGRFRPVNPLMTHISLMGSLAFFFATAPFREKMFSQKKVCGPAPSTEEFVGHIQEMMIHGIAARHAGNR